MVSNLLKGMPVLVMKRGHWPNKNDIADVMAAWPGYTIRTEVLHHPGTRYCVTVRRQS